MQLSDRKKQILNTIIKEHIKTAAPVGSSYLVNKYKLDISPATVRNEMGELEEEGYIIQPHTSAGRVPTEKAYNLYLNGIKAKKLSETETNIFDRIFRGTSGREDLKIAAKELAKQSGQAVFWAFERHNFYYTGISNLIQQPEFSQVNSFYSISVIIDRIDEVLEKVFDRLEPGTNILLGQNNPFSSFCSSIISKREGGSNGHHALFGILGPLRMNYEKNISLIEYLNQKLKQTA